MCSNRSRTSRGCGGMLPLTAPTSHFSRKYGSNMAAMWRGVSSSLHVTEYGSGPPLKFSEQRPVSILTASFKSRSFDSGDPRRFVEFFLDVEPHQAAS